MTAQPNLHPITLEVVRNGIFAIAEEMSAVIIRSARSPLLREAGDFSSALTDGEGRLIAQGKDIPIHLGVMSFTVREFLKRVPPEELEEGDHYILNLPEVGGNHLPDVKVLRPVFMGDRIVAFAITLAHWADIGGGVPGSYVPWATEACQEGLRIPPIKVFDRNGPIKPAREFVLENVRGRTERDGDMLAQYAANETAAKRLQDMFGRYGVETVSACFERFMDESEQRMIAAIREIPEGTYEGEDWLDDDGIEDGPFPIRVAVTIRDGRAKFDFTGSSPQVKGPINTTPYVAHSAVYYCLKALVGPDIPANEGCYRPITAHTPAGSILNPAPNAPVVGGNHETSYRIADAVFRALAPALPGRITAGGPTTAGIMVIGGRREGRDYVLYECHGGGEGASERRDGGHVVRVHVANTMNTPVEVIEAEYPVRVERAELREGSGGLGQHCGGLGQVRAYRVLHDSTLTTMIERRVVAPWGAFGGADGQPFRITRERGGERRDIKGKEVLALRAGDLATIETSGGGGYGPPDSRDPDLLESDRIAGYR